MPIRKAKEHQELVGRKKELFRQRTEMPSGVTYENTEDCALVKLNRIPPHNPHAETKERLQGRIDIQLNGGGITRRHNHEAIEVGAKGLKPAERPDATSSSTSEGFDRTIVPQFEFSGTNSICLSAKSNGVMRPYV